MPNTSKTEQQPILAVVPYPFLPPKKGGEWCTYYTCEHLAANMPMVVAGTVQELESYPKRFAFKSLFADNKWKYLSPAVGKSMLQLGKEMKAGWLFLHQPFMGIMAKWVSSRLGVPLLVYVHNLEFARFKSMGKPWWRLMYALETWLYRRADLLLFISEEERQEAMNIWGLAVEKCLYVPYGVVQAQAPQYSMANAKKELGLPADRPVFLFFGAMRYAPNEEALALLVEEVAPAWRQQGGEEAVWVICGGGLGQEWKDRLAKLPHFQYMGFVENLDAYIQAADIMLNPVLSGGGVKTKVMEALGWGKSVVSTHSGAQGIDRQYCANKLSVVPNGNWPAFARAMKTALPTASVPMPSQFYKQYYWPNIMTHVADRIKQ